MRRDLKAAGIGSRLGYKANLTGPKGNLPACPDSCWSVVLQVETQAWQAWGQKKGKQTRCARWKRGRDCKVRTVRYGSSGKVRKLRWN